MMFSKQNKTKQNKLAKIAALGLIGLGAVSTASATVITFDNTTTSVSGGGNAAYTESGLTITPNSQFFTIDSAFSNSAPSYNGTDFGFFQNPPSFTLSMINPFSLQSFSAANLFGSNTGGDVRVDGFQGGAMAAFTQTFHTLGSRQWSLFSFTGWNNLTSVKVTATSNFLGLDDITVNAPTAATPVPAAVWLFGSGLAGLVASRRKNKFSGLIKFCDLEDLLFWLIIQKC